MKSCPTCKRTYPGDEFVFCLEDGALLSAPHDTTRPQRETGVAGGTAPVTEVLVGPTIPARRTPLPQSTIRSPAPQSPQGNEGSRSTQIAVRVGAGHWLLRAGLVLRGLATIILTIAFFWLVRSYQGFFAVLSAQLLLSGALALVMSVGSYMEYHRGGGFLVDAMGSLVAGLVVLVMGFGSGGTGVRLVFLLVPIWAIVIGVAEIAAATHLRKHISGEILLAVAGAVSVICGIGMGITYFTRLLPFAFFRLGHGLIFGVLTIILGIRLRNKARREQTTITNRGGPH